MKIKSWAFSIGEHEVSSVKLTLFFEGLIEGLKEYEADRDVCFGEESRKLTHIALSLVLSNITHAYPDIDLSVGFKKLPEDVDISAAQAKVASLAAKVLKVKRIPGGK